jgi:isoleucyl-tRNA synthetase
VRGIVLDELNVKTIRWAERRADFVHHDVRPNFRVLGKRLGARMKGAQAALAAADGDDLAARLERDGRLVLEDVGGETMTLEASDLEVRLIEKEGLATARDEQFLVALDTQLTPELIAEGRAREVVNRIQSARKDLDLAYTDRIRVRYRAAPELGAAIEAHREFIAAETLAVDLAPGDDGLQSAPIDDLDFAFAVALG